jgi:hypothetical protein
MKRGRPANPEKLRLEKFFRDRGFDFGTGFRSRVRLDTLRRLRDMMADAETDWEFEDANFPLEDWRYEVSNDITRLGYKAWVRTQDRRLV